MTDRFSQVAKAALKFRDDRDWRQFHTPKNLASAIAIEAAELQELFLWNQEPRNESVVRQKQKQISQELADVAIFCIYLADAVGIDLISAMEDKIRVNDEKYPVETAKGRSDKYTEL